MREPKPGRPEICVIKVLTLDHNHCLLAMTGKFGPHTVTDIHYSSFKEKYSLIHDWLRGNIRTH